MQGSTNITPNYIYTPYLGDIFIPKIYRCAVKANPCKDSIKRVWIDYSNANDLHPL